EVANNTVAAQQELVSNFETALSGYQTFSSLQSAKVNSVEMQASLVSNDINTANGAMNDVSTQAQEEQATLSQLSTDMANFYAQIPSTLPASSITQLDSDISNVQAAISASSSSISALQAEASAFEQTTLNSMPNYLVAFQADDNSVESNNQALLSSYATLQADLSTITSLFPLAILLQWQTALATIGQTLSSETTSLTSYLQNTVSDLTSAQSSLSSFATLVQTSASQIELGDGLLANFTDIYNSENLYLNSSSLAQLEISLASIQATAQMSAEFVAASQSLLQATTTGLASSVQSLYSKGNSLASQTSASLAATINASSFLSSDLSIRSNSLSSARLEASQALNLFDDLQIPQGASLLSQAKIQVQIASKIA
ncbi:MAG: hypothetical protein M1368_09710, partial [Thaumarchaeota archaeon]|nr:hypothetical protein [Nitrososphaerota archaeon]